MPAQATPVFLDLAAISLYAFFAFFAGLIYYLRTEDKREGYPLVSDRPGVPRPEVHGFPGTPKPKYFILPHGGTVSTNGPAERDISAAAEPYDPYPGAPLVPVVDPMQAGIGTASYVNRSEHPDLTWDDATPKVVPLRAAAGWGVEEGDPEIRGRVALGLDGKVAGTVADLWVDKSEYLFRYVEVEVAATGKRTLVPIGLVTWRGDGPVRIETATAAQVAAAPTLSHPTQVSLREEDRMSGYFGGGELYATPNRVEPLV
ncbi:photosynthetic reaction center subunit H [Falsiroseomonas sp. CW058]|uniref:photosynthetic reaction center subunit H n=1 Tax=Falsiroseomonas sp. CW058 TaxID=3388664 RepID=UPI003D311B6E